METSLIAKRVLLSITVLFCIATFIVNSQLPQSYELVVALSSSIVAVSFAFYLTQVFFPNEDKFKGRATTKLFAFVVCIIVLYFGLPLFSNLVVEKSYFIPYAAMIWAGIDITLGFMTNYAYFCLNDT